MRVLLTTQPGYGSLAAQMLGVPSAALQVASPTLMSDAVLAAVAAALDEGRPRLGLAPDASNPRPARSTAGPYLDLLGTTESDLTFALG